MPGTISSDVSVPSAAASAASASRACCSRSARSSTDQRLAVAVEAGVDARFHAGRLLRLGDRGIEFALRGQAERDRILGRDVGHVPVAAVADRGDGRAGRADQLAKSGRR